MKAQDEEASVVPIRASGRHVSHGEFSLRELQRGSVDKLGHRIIEILWLSPDYGIYLTELGVFVHFSDDKDKAAVQRAAFTTICPELCELRYLTGEMHGTDPLGFFKRSFRRDNAERQGHSLFDHNMAQSLMLLMEGKIDDAKAIATAALDMAVARVTNDNTIRYLRAALGWAIALSLIPAIIWTVLRLSRGSVVVGWSEPYLVASVFGILGAAFSIMTRIQWFRMKPCQQSNMNHWMALIRILIGMIGGLALFLLAQSALGQSLTGHLVLKKTWEGAALIGFLGGFAERMVQSMFGQAASAIGGATGTPVQRARGTEKGAVQVGGASEQG